ncbi:carbohydrate ABC transporter permease [Methylobacterium frigidaeris]|uniref:Inner membrane ABC transporter permease protein YcjO n=1 Tax=Methylobacterium frigidaeris TaxID=2038277 RepID=A0AA37HGP5_9HYPH|nr:sugar ABC transporter permease [Methylobacterium frigidaeris]GJD65742.1 Inner membrane ABC transporter permease protein YcjO [Methylobacterium frigidaeris]
MRPSSGEDAPGADRRERWLPFLFVGPAILLLLAVLGLPAVTAVLQSFNLVWVREPGFSLDAYRQLATDPQFATTLSTTALYVGLVVSLHLTIGLAVALALNADLPAKWLFRVAAILPWTVPDVISGIIWRFVFDTLPGMANAILLRLGAVDQPVDWLGSPSLAFFGVVTAEVWRGYPFVMLILLAGLQAIPAHLYEAAAIDGAGAWQSFRYVTLPALRNMVIVALVLDVIWEARLFGTVYGMTGGGPGDATQLVSTLTFRQYFEFFNPAYASAMAVVLAVTMLIVAIPYLRVTMSRNA